MIQWDADRKVYTDYMGYPLSRSDVIQMRANIKLHLKKSAPDLAELANEQRRRDMPQLSPLTPEGFK